MKSFTVRVALRFAGLVTATSAAVLVIAGMLLRHEAERGLELLHDVEVRELTGLIGATERLTPDEVAARVKLDADDDAALFVIQVSDMAGNIFFRSDNLGGALLPSTIGAERHATLEIPSLGPVHVSMYRRGPWQIHIGSPLAPSERLLRTYTRLAVPLLLGVAALSLAVGYAFSRATLRPVRAIEATARRISADNLRERIPAAAGADELASLVALLNQTFDRLEAAFAQVRQFSADASHELKTPLALIRLNVEKLRSRLSGAQPAPELDDVLDQITRLHQVINRLLFLAQAEGGGLPIAPRPVAMEPWIRSIAEDAHALAADRGVGFRLGHSDEGELHADPDLLRQLLLNLLSNAVRVCPAGGTVELRSHAAAGGWELAVRDEGPGVPAADLPRLFGRFVRLDGAQNRPGGTSGHGLGLAICKTIATLHGGTIEAANRTDRSGLVVTVRLPRRA